MVSSSKVKHGSNAQEVEDLIRYEEGWIKVKANIAHRQHGGEKER